jgi:hypothetical protein
LGRSISASAATATEMSRTSQTKALKKKRANTEPTPYDEIKVPDSLGMFMVSCDPFCLPHNFGAEKLKEIRYYLMKYVKFNNISDSLSIILKNLRGSDLL